MIATVKGFTFIEVLIAVFIITVSLLGLAIGFSNGFAWMEEVREVSVANRIAQEKMEELRGGMREIPNPGSPITISEDPYEIIIVATQVESALTQVTVAISWESRPGKALSRNLVTYFTENGITKK